MQNSNCSLCLVSLKILKPHGRQSAPNKSSVPKNWKKVVPLQIIASHATPPSRVKWQGNREKGSGILIIKLEALNVEEYFGKVCLVSDEEDKQSHEMNFQTRDHFERKKHLERANMIVNKWHIIRNSLQCFTRVCPPESNLTTMLLHKNFSEHKVIILTMCNL